MKTLKFIGATVIMIITALTLSYCHNDDDDDDNDSDVNLAMLPGTWISTNQRGHENYGGEEDSWNDNYDPNNPTDGCTKIVITNTSGNTFQVKQYEYESSGWGTPASYSVTVTSNSFTMTQGTETAKITFLQLNSTNMVINRIASGTEDGIKFTSESETTYKKMN